MNRFVFVLALLGLAVVTPRAQAQPPDPFWFDLTASVCGASVDYARYANNPNAQLHLYLQVDDPVHPGGAVYDFVIANTPGMQQFQMPQIRGYQYCGTNRWCPVYYRLKIVVHGVGNTPVVASMGPIGIKNYSWQPWYFRRSDTCPNVGQWKGPGEGPEPAASWGTLKGAYR